MRTIRRKGQIKGSLVSSKNMGGVRDSKVSWVVKGMGREVVSDLEDSASVTLQ